jgi:hypothetical protein
MRVIDALMAGVPVVQVAVAGFLVGVNRLRVLVDRTLGKAAKALLEAGETTQADYDRLDTALAALDGEEPTA